MQRKTIAHLFGLELFLETAINGLAPRSSSDQYNPLSSSSHCLFSSDDAAAKWGGGVVVVGAVVG
jgi:hypothetical protein